MKGKNEPSFSIFNKIKLCVGAIFFFQTIGIIGFGDLNVIFKISTMKHSFNVIVIYRYGFCKL
jgi:hypothetical protein